MVSTFVNLSRDIGNFAASDKWNRANGALVGEQSKFARHITVEALSLRFRTL
jgi:hypothetical protein